MTIAFLARLPANTTDQWLEALRAALPGERIVAGLANDADIAVVANPAPGQLATMPGLRFIQSAWAGVDGLLGDPALPVHLPLARLIDPGLATQMAEAVAAHVLALHRQAPAYRDQQAQGVWNPLPQPPAAERQVGLLGFGEMARASAALLEKLGFRVCAWSRSHGDLDDLLASSDIVVNLLPLTAQTRGVLGRDTFGRMKLGTSVINVGRGGHLVEADLLAALASGQISHAVLDVFETEPLPADHAFWPHPAITITPHVAAATDPVSASARIAANIARFRRGEPIEGLVSPQAGY
ncbi:MAG: glyoxylate/hydroxypyruvate reductase A [Pseudomonadota bacterium]|uniref:2-hydroxyacid dehydrogenase n=1 Tax=Phenylobacterium sp. TaxID=1871053 RepID=UPI0025EFC695|nr:glyoxylate/hydroxypyruvate reductase A [Phenylobacterium sp.]MBT9472091.1 glyoxylate/hydroxypyruvate reductase A [Phenylobacterium sp.]